MYIQVIKEIVISPEELHSIMVRDTQICLDMPKSKDGLISPCEKALQKNPNACISMKSMMMFTCPKTCGLCGEDGKTCFDFYEFKCPVWKEAGDCSTNKDEMMMKCRKTCGFCTIAAEPGKKEVHHIKVQTKKEEYPKVILTNNENSGALAIDPLNHNSPPIAVIQPGGINHNSPPVIPVVLSPEEVYIYI
jgi:hypothetical protein